MKLALAIIGVLAALALGWWLKQPLYYRRRQLSDLDRFVLSLVAYMTIGSMLYLRHRGSARFFQLVKAQEQRNKPFVRFVFPDAEWSEAYFPKMMRAFEANDIQFSIDNQGEAGARRFMVVDIKGTPDRIVAKTKRVLYLANETVGLDSDAQFTFCYGGHFDPEIAKASRKLPRLKGSIESERLSRE